MAIKVLTTRRFRKNTLEEAHRVLRDLRAATTVRRGFISGQTLISSNDPYKLLVISTWTKRKRFDEWRASEKRKEFSEKLTALLETPEHDEIYYVGEREPEWIDMA